MRIKLIFLRLSILSTFVLCANFIFAQRTITGKVTDSSTNQPVAGSTISVRGSKAAAQTNSEGNFSISVPDKTAKLIVSSVGFETQDVVIGSENNIAVSLKISNTRLTDVVVVGYGTQKRKDLTGSVSSVTATQIEKVPVTTLDQALQGRAAGVQIINNDASPGGNISVLIRGVGSLASGGNNPLYVVDGYPTTGGINNINPNDIASIDVLKDASATAIYGIRAANGVVIITTKKGTKK